jgi:hypothetical protein
MHRQRTSPNRTETSNDAESLRVAFFKRDPFPRGIATDSSMGRSNILMNVQLFARRYQRRQIWSTAAYETVEKGVGMVTGFTLI